MHEQDLALANACARGDEAAWDRFVLEFRPVLYRAADAIDPSGGARETADSLYGELYGLKEKDGQRRSLFTYFQGRSSLATWLRAILSQRYVDRIRANRRLEELPDDEAVQDNRSARSFNTLVRHDPDASRFATAMESALRETLAALEPRDRLRLGCYYSQEMTLVQIGRLTRESEATVSRALARTRRAIRDDVRRRLREEHKLSEVEIGESLAGVLEDAGEFDLEALFGGRKKSADDRSKSGELP